MVTIAEKPDIARLQESVRKFSRQKDMLHRAFLLLRMMVMFWILYFRSRKTIRMVRKTMEGLRFPCSNVNLDDLYSQASDMRHNLDVLSRLIPGKAPTRAIKKRAHELFIDWDDVAEDVYMAKDPELHDLIAQLEQRL